MSDNKTRGAELHCEADIKLTTNGASALTEMAFTPTDVRSRGLGATGRGYISPFQLPPVVDVTERLRSPPRDS